MNQTFSTPVLLVVFNRPDETKQLLEAVAKVKPSKIYVAADAPRENNANDKLKCKEVRDLVTSLINWDCDLKLHFREINLGCGLGPAEAYDWFFNQEEEGIVLEDDCIPTQSFFYYCQELLEKYRDDKRIFSINGNSFGYTYNSKSSYFLGRFINSFGWASWRRSYKLVDYTLSEWTAIKNKKKFLHSRLNKRFDYDLGWIKYWEGVFDRTQADYKAYWDFQWMFAQLYHKQYSIIPAKNLVSNIGFSESGTHLNDENDPLSKLQSEELQFPLKHCQISTDMLDEEFERDYVKKLWCYQKTRRGVFFYTKMWVAKFFKK